MLWLHNNKFQYLMNNDDRLFLKSAENESIKYNLGFKALSLFMLMQIRIGISPRNGFRLLNRPAGRLWIYDLGLLYFGTYSFLLSHIIGIRKVYDQRLDNLCQNMVRSRKKTNVDKLMDFTLLEDWKCYLYKFDLFFARLF